MDTIIACKLWYPNYLGEISFTVGQRANDFYLPESNKGARHAIFYSLC